MTINRTPFGGIRGGADITGDAQLFTLRTVVAIAGGDYGTTDNPQRNLLRIAQVIQNKSVLNYINITEEVVDLSDPANQTFYGLGTEFNQANTTVYTFRFVTEQPGFVEVDTILGELDGVTMPFPTVDVLTNTNPTLPVPDITQLVTGSGAADRNLSLSVENFAG